MGLPYPTHLEQSKCCLRHFQGLPHVEDLEDLEEAKKPLRYSTVPNGSAPPSQ